jgi:hypothetical protein
MTANAHCVIATTTKLNTQKFIEATRAKLVFQMLEKSNALGFDVICVDGGSPKDLVCEMLLRGAKIVRQKSGGMGNARRQAIRLARQKAALTFSPIVWLEPEKCSLIQHLPRAITLMKQKCCNMVMFNRASLESYPPEQAMSYALVRLAAKYLLNLDLDFMFGPLLFDDSVAKYFLKYRGRYGDKWDSIHVPKLRAFLENSSYQILKIDYKHPADQTKAETGNMNLLMKRIEQAKVVTNCLMQEVKLNKCRRVS